MANPEILRKYRYVDFAARARSGFRNCLISLDEVPRFIRRYGAFGCYSTFYLFDERLLSYAREHPRGGHPSVAGYSGPVFAPVWPLDVDAPRLDEALQATRAICERLTRKWGVSEEALRVYFSGKKGFHVTVDTRVFGAPAPSVVLPEVFHRLTRRLAQELGFASTGPLDLALRDRVRLLRLPNTRHETTALFKVALEKPEFWGLASGGIRRLARGPRPLEHSDPTGLIGTLHVARSETACAVFQECLPGPSSQRRERPRTAPGGPGVLACVARRRLLKIAAPEGQRNNTAIRLASWLREGSLASEEVEEALLGWNASNPEPLDEEEVLHVIASAFAPPEPYHYGCRDPLIVRHCPTEPSERRACPYHGRLHRTQERDS